MNIFWQAVMLVLSVFAVLLCYLFYDRLMNQESVLREHKLYFVVWIVVIGGLLFYNRKLVFVSYGEAILRAILMWISIIIVEKRRKLTSFSIVFCLTVLLELLNLCYAFAVMPFLRDAFWDVMYFGVGGHRILIYVLSAATMTILCYTALVYLRRTKIEGAQLKRLFLILGCTGLGGIVWCQIKMQAYGYKSSIRNMLFLIITILVTFCFIVIYIKNLDMKAEAEIIQMKQELLEKNYIDMQRYYEQSLYTYHDMKNHFLLLQEYCTEGDMSKVQAYLEKLGAPARMLEQFVWCDNRAINFVLNAKILEASSNGICIETNIDSFNLAEIEDSDFCIILSDLLDNAIETCMHIQEERAKISVFIKQKGNVIILKIENTIAHIPITKEGVYISEKGTGHGYGMKSVRANVEKYGGVVEWSHTEDKFTAMVTFF